MWASVFAALAMAVAPSTVVQRQDFDAQARVTEALQAIRPIAYHTRTLDWAAIEGRARTLAEGARDEVDLLPVYQSLVWYLQDNHSHIRPSAALQKGWQDRYGDRRLLPDSPARRRSQSGFRDRRDVEVREIHLPGAKTAALIIVPSVQWAEGEISAPYGNALYRSIAAVERRACGYIVDVRGNTGGDVWPIVTGLSDLIGDGHRFSTADAQGRLTSLIKLSEGAAVTDPAAPDQPVLNRVGGWRATAVDAAPVAVLIDDGTASSGEGVVLAFKGRNGVRLFGETTAGLASSNEVIDLSDGMRLLITTAMAADRTGTVYPDGISPDEAIAAGPGQDDNPEDAVVEAAQFWIAGQEACR